MLFIIIIIISHNKNKNHYLNKQQRLQLLLQNLQQAHYALFPPMNSKF
jgi:phosphopantetheine adenylyltransferase